MVKGKCLPISWRQLIAVLKDKYKIKRHRENLIGNIALSFNLVETQNTADSYQTTSPLATFPCKLLQVEMNVPFVFSVWQR